MSTITNEFEAYAVGIVSASVCSSLPPAEVERRLSMEYPTGISSRWEISDETEFSTGQPHPCPCERAPETHKHYLLHC